MTMLSMHAGTRTLEGWKASLRELGGREPGEIGVGECDGLVDELVAIAESAGGAGAIGAAGAAVAEMFGEFRGGTEYNLVLQGVLSRVCMVPGGCGGLGAFFGAVKIEDEESDRGAYFALDAVRVVLRHLFVREGDLRESRQEVLGACYDAILRAAERNGLANLSGIMRGGAAREELCGPGAEISRMAMLRVAVYDKRDVPSDGEVLEVLGRYPALSGVLNPKRVVESKPRLARLLHHVSLSHLAAREGHAWEYAALRESDARIGYWLDSIYRLHGVAGGLGGGRAGAGGRVPAPSAPEIMAPIRYLAMEICDFWELYGKSRALAGELDVPDPAGTRAAVRGESEIKGAVEELCGGFGARPDWAFSEAAGRVAAVGMERLMLYAHLVLMFQDAIYGTVPDRHRGDCAHDAMRLGVHERLDAGALSEGEVAGTGGATSVSLGAGGRHGRLTTMLESAACLSLLRKNFVEGLGRRDGSPDGHFGFPGEVYNIKYMILELANFIEQYKEMKVAVSRGGKPVTPGFLGREDTYLGFRDSYAARRREAGVGDIQGLVEGDPGFVSGVLRDASEACLLAARIPVEPHECAEIPDVLMTDEDLRRMCGRLERIRAGLGRRGGRPAGPGPDRAAQEAGEEASRVVGPGQGRAAGGPARGRRGSPEPPAARRGPGRAYASGDMGIMCAQSDVLREAQEAISGARGGACDAGALAELLHEDPEAAIAALRVRAWFGSWEGRPPGQARGAGTGFVAEVGGARCRFGVAVLGGELVWLTDNRRSTMRQDAIGEHRRAMAREIVTRVSGCAGGLPGRGLQAVAVVWDPLGSVRRNGGLEEALAELGRRCPQLSAVALAGGGGLEVHDVPGSSNPLGGRVREAMLRAGGRGQPAPDTAGPPR